MSKLHLLNDAKLRKAKPKVDPKTGELKVLTLSDGGGLCLVVSVNGSKLWRMRYTFEGKACMASLGPYPDLSLAEARSKAEAWRKSLLDGVNPLQQRRAREGAAAVDAQNSFRACALAFLERDSGRAPKYRYEKKRALERDVFPVLGARDVASITPQDVLAVVEKVQLGERNAHEQAKKTRIYMSQVFKFAAERGKLPMGSNPAELVRDAVIGNTKRAGVKVKHMPAMPWTEMPRFLQRLDGYAATPRTSKLVELGVKLLVLTLMRPGSVADARWSEFHLDGPNPVWVRPKMKNGEMFAVPLSRQAVAVLRELEVMGKGRLSDFVLPGASGDKGLSDGTFVKALRIMGYSKDGTAATAHGFRTTGRTYMGDRGVPFEVAEWCIAHTQKNKTVASYSRTTMLAQRRLVMQWYADTLDAVKAAGSTAGVKLPLPVLTDVEPEELDVVVTKGRG